MRILVIGSGAREHALLRGLSQDSTTTDLHVSPGNVGMENLATRHEDTRIDDPLSVLLLAQEIDAELVVIGPEVPLVSGVADALRADGIPVFGPNKDAAQIEGSKSYAKDVMAAAGVRTARAEVLVPGISDSGINEALDRFGPTWVVKDDGLAAGKGVVVSTDRDLALEHVHNVLATKNPVLLESFLDGPEISLLCLVDGETVVPLLPAQDHKRIFDNDEGPNTGGMGAYAPLPWLSDTAVTRIVDDICIPVAKEMVKRGHSYSGLLYAGIAWGQDGPAVVEFNCRFGDPETQAVLELLKTPLAVLLNSVATGTLAEQPALDWEDGYAVAVVLAAKNYPGTPRTGDVITGIDSAHVLHAGTDRNAEGELVSAGGRVLSVVGSGATLAEAREAAYTVMGEIHLDGGQYRTDIALNAVEGRISI